MNFYLLETTRSRVVNVLKGREKSIQVSELMGGVENFRRHLESQLPEGWNWDNHGVVWEIDHKRPLASFDLTDESQLRQAFHFSNVQPLSKFDNRSKGASHVSS